MNSKGTIRHLLPFLLATLSVVSCDSPIKEPEFVEARNFRVGRLGLKQTQVFMTLDYFNPNRVGMSLEKADLDVYMDGKFVGKTALDTMIAIPAKDTFSIPVKIDVDMKNAFSNLYKVGINEEVELMLKGTARVKKAGIGINVPVNYKGRHKLR